MTHSAAVAQLTRTGNQGARLRTVQALTDETRRERGQGTRVS